MTYPFRPVEGGLLLFVKVLPKSSCTAIVGVEGDRLKIKIHAPPDKGKANDALISFLAKKLKIAHSSIEIRSGHSARLKTLFLHGCQDEKLVSLICDFL